MLATGLLWAGAEAAHAGTVSLPDRCPNYCSGHPGEILVWEGEPGESNDVAVSRGSDGTTVLVERGAGARLVAADTGSACKLEDRTATCAGPISYVLLYGHDRDDRLSADALDDDDGVFTEYIFGGAGDDFLDGGDHYCCHGGRLYPGPGDDEVHGGTGDYDDVTYEERESPIDASLAPRPAGARNGEEGEHDVYADDVDGLWGGDANDVLHGDEGDNYIYTEYGADTVYGGGGDDVLWGMSWFYGDPDTFYGEDGDDHIYPGPDHALVDGGAGVDSVRYDNQGRFYLTLSLDGKANDGGVLSDNPWDPARVPDGQLVNVETLRSEKVNDLLVGDDGPNRFEADEGSDIILAGGGRDEVDADWGAYDPGGADFIWVRDGEVDDVRCGDGIDVVVMDLDDRLADDCEQATLDDLPIPELDLPDPPQLPEPRLPELPGAVPVLAAPGDLPFPAQVAPPPATGGSAGAESCAVIGASRKARITTGTSAGDCLVGGGGNDRLTGRSGDDRLVGGDGRDRLAGGTGNDWIDAGGGGDRADGGAGEDFLIGAGGADALLGAAGDDVIVASDGRRDKVDCGKGRDTAVVDRADRVRNCELVSRTKATR
ncbi:MAG TPA: hypothetical protein VF712_04230 [Thermoleophilaceae bacterium]